MALITAFLVLAFPVLSLGLDNGLALTPPMGWLSWERFTCNTDCENEPADCISERLYKDMADRMVSDGYKDAGYEYVNIDDCWMERERGKDGKLVPDRTRFPNGIKGLADYIHSKGLKLGIYQDVGSMTCAQYPGSYGYFEIDAKTFAEWEVDMVKVDGCYADVKEMDRTYPEYSDAVVKSGRDIVFSCEWPFYQEQAKVKPDYARIAKYCHLYRNFDDVNDSWGSVLSVVDFFAENQDDLVPAAGPGHWNDPDMILAGNFGLSFDEAKAQFLLWAVLASPLLMSNDLRDIKKPFSDLLKNREIIAVNQDPLGKMGKRVHVDNGIEIWSRPISPVNNVGEYSYAVVFFNRNNLGGATNVSVSLSSLGMNCTLCYTAYDVFRPDFNTTLCPGDLMTSRVNPSGANMIVARVNNGQGIVDTSLGVMGLLFFCLIMKTMEDKRF